MSRSEARRQIDSKSLQEKLAADGIAIYANTPNVLAEEAPDAYKDVDEGDSFDVGSQSGSTCCKMRPFW